MSRDHEIVAVALAIERWQRQRAPLYIAEQLGAVALAGDLAGIAHWQAVAAAFDSLTAGSALQ